MSAAPLLVELLCEELPPKALKRLGEAFAEGIVTGHNNMPEFAFEPDDVTAIIAYLDTLKTD